MYCRRKREKIEKWTAGVLTPDDHLKNRTMRESDYKNKQVNLSFCGFLNKWRRACQYL